MVDKSLLVMSEDELREFLSTLESQLRDQLVNSRWTRSDIRRVRGVLKSRFPGGI